MTDPEDTAKAITDEELCRWLEEVSGPPYDRTDQWALRWHAIKNVRRLIEEVIFLRRMLATDCLSQDHPGVAACVERAVLEERRRCLRICQATAADAEKDEGSEEYEYLRNCATGRRLAAWDIRDAIRAGIADIPREEGS
jgi:hypothetical protein